MVQEVGNPEVSIVIPVFNEEESLPPLFATLDSFLRRFDKRTEVILVDDGSRDGTPVVLAEQVAMRPGFRMLRLRANRGQTAAMAAGLEAARGHTIVFMDADLQNDPDDIPRLVAKLDEGFDLVSGWRRNRQDAAFTRNFPSRVANRLIGWVTGVKVHDYGCSLKAYRSAVVKPLPLYSDMHRFLPALCTRLGARVTELPVQHHPRRLGKSKYGLNRIFKVLADLTVIKMIVAFADRPMHYFGLISLLFLTLTGVSFSLWMTNLSEGWKDDTIIIPALIFLFFSSFLYCVSLGLLADLILRARGQEVYGAERQFAIEVP